MYLAERRRLLAKLKEIKVITNKQAEKMSILDDRPKKLYLILPCKANLGRYVVIDNSDGDAFTEEYNEIGEAIAYLLGIIEND